MLFFFFNGTHNIAVATVINDVTPPVDSLVSEDDALNAGTKQHHAGHVWAITDKGKPVDICVCVAAVKRLLGGWGGALTDRPS